MLEAAPSIFAFLAALFLIGRYGFYPGMWYAWFGIMLLVPWWLFVEVRSIRLDPASACSIGILICLLRQRTQGSIKFVLGDYLILLIIISECLTQFYWRSLAPLGIPEYIRSWLLPYLMGRILIRDENDIPPILRILCVIVPILALFAIVEAFTQMNILAKLTGKHWELLEGLEGYRWGLKRAQGNENHPIYFGLTLVILLPWMFEAAYRAAKKKGPQAWRLTPWVVGAGAVVSVSRAAQLGVLIVTLANFFYHQRWLRIPMILLALLGGAGFLVFEDEVIEALSAAVGEQESSAGEVVEIYGEETPYSGTKHRQLLWKVYKEAVEKVGWLGYSADFAEHSPPPGSDDIRFKSLDDNYLNVLLKFGPLGVICFLWFTACAAYYLLRVAIDTTSPYSSLAAGLFSAFVGVAVLIKSVAWAPDYGWVWLMTAGVAGRLQVLRLLRLSRKPGITGPVF